MVIRIWRTRVQSDRQLDYFRFTQDESLPMFQRQPGFLGVLFARSESDFAVVSLWKGQEAVRELQTSPTYRLTVARIMATGFLVGEPSLEVFEVQAGALAPDIVNQV